MMRFDPCRTITETEWAEEWSSQRPGAVFCNKCEEKGRHGFDRHIRERQTGYCACCRRDYQRAYYLAKKHGTGPTVGMTKNLKRIDELRKLIPVWVATRDEDIMNEVRNDYLPELNGLERATGLDETKLVDILYAQHTELVEKQREREAAERDSAIETLQRLTTEAT